ncbi:E3 UBIQUITIN-PROTEIN LIGASE PRT1-LIKE [Salix viminalis]|uniref:E3 UBIQUITIN-PROTEIN LIGASE PRT1-LIKE n=1 Tax=Salix viminalis TaxID=40686 RepID=A0A9Q0QAJ8_SALVM|nr:E3 UBIQUITIN-PROTEIN LIGASE PRT1-LIKE [Salix viminalis]
MENKDNNKIPSTEESKMQRRCDNNKKTPSPKHLQQIEEDNVREEEDFLDEFQCSVCLDLLYKPVVLACGHLSCFWCVFHSMNMLQESRCPICRHLFNHFPSVCQLLHFLLIKMYPIAYKRREREVGEEEKKIGQFSPQFVHHPFGSHSGEEMDFQSNSLHFPIHPQNKLCSDGCFSEEKEPSSLGNFAKAIAHREDNMKIVPSTPSSRSEGTTNAAIENCNMIRTESGHGIKTQASVADLLCAECKKLLFRPVVLNCGHVYCESCIISSMQGIPRCQICRSLHPNGIPSVCLVLEKFLEEHFSEIYAERRQVFAKQTDCSSSTHTQQLGTQSSSVSASVYSSWIFGNGPEVHIGVGCDSCGMIPIIGKRYKCKDCSEEIGFDVCESCHNNPSEVSGRFNQQHKPEHNFEIAQPQCFGEFIQMLNLDHSDDSDDDGNDFPAPVLSDDALQDGEDSSNDLSDVSASVLSVDFAPDQKDYPNVS